MIHPSGKALVSLRISGAVFCNLFLHWALLVVFIIAVNMELTDIALWFKNTVSFHISFRFWLFTAPLAIVTVAQGIVSCREYLLAPSYPTNRVSAICGLFSVYNLVLCCLYAYIGFSVPLIYTSVEENEFSSFKVSCDDEECLSEDRLFFILGGIWTGIYYFLHNHVFRTRYLDFPFLQQWKSIMVKSSIHPTFKASVRNSFVPIMLYLSFYYIQGNNIRDVFTHLFGLKVYPGDLDNLFNLFTLKRLCHIWIFSVTTIFTLKMMEIMIKIYLMQRYEFAMYHTTSPISQFIMEEGLSRVDVPIIRHLAFWDLALLSENDAGRRKEIYTLSQPGGHPYTWRGIKKQCFDAIDNFTSSLEQTVKTPTRQSHCTSPHSSKQQRYESTEYFVSSNPESPLFCSNFFSSVLRQTKKIVIEFLFSKLAVAGESRVVRYLFGDIPKLRVNNLVVHSLPVAWAAESLSFLLCASLSEDTYGVLQSDIPVVISTLLRLQTALDSLHKNPSVLRKFHSPKCDAVSKMHNILSSKVKRSLYYLAIHFRPFISDLQLPKNDEIRLLAYCCFKE